MRLQGQAALGLCIFEVVDAGEVPVGQCGVGQRPEVLSRLQLGRVGRQEEQVEVLRHAQPRARVPAGAIQDQHNLLGRAGADLAGEGGKLGLEERDADGGGQVEAGLARGGVDEAHHVAPCVAMLHRRDRTVPVEAPHFVQDRFQPDAVLVGRPELDRRLGIRGRDGLDERPDLFLKSAWAAGSACTC